MMFAYSSFPLGIWCFQGCHTSFTFSTIVNDIHLSLNNAVIKLLADDTHLFIGGDNFDLLYVTLTSEFKSF